MKANNHGGLKAAQTRFSTAYACEPLESRLLLALVVPPMNSQPGSSQTLYLDFNGSEPFNWNPGGTNYLVRGPGGIFSLPNPVPAFGFDADPNNFSDAELSSIAAIWAWVSEKFSPFTLNVTTVDPGVVVDSQNMTCLIGGSASDWYDGTAGGVADRDGFFDGGENTCFAFSADSAGSTYNRRIQFLGETIAHEAGHEVGLEHQRTWNMPSAIPSVIDEYHAGDTIRAPIMGGSSNNPNARGIWWYTNNWPGQNSFDPLQPDLQALTQDAPSRLFYRNDDYNLNTPQMVFSGAGVLTPLNGVIERETDIDGFAFNATSTRASFTISNAALGGMLAPSASIRISGTSTVIPANLTLTNTSATIEATNLTPGGNYVLMVKSQGGYGDVGQYTVSGAMQQFAAYDAASRTLTVSGFVGNNNVAIDKNFVSGEYHLRVKVSVNGGPLSMQTFPLDAVDTLVVTLGSGNDILDYPGLFHSDGVSLGVISTLGGGNDILRVGGFGGVSSFDVGQNVISWTFPDDSIASVFNSDADHVELIGTSTENIFRINDQNSYSTIDVYGDQGDDQLIVGPEVFALQAPRITFHGDAGVDTLQMGMSSVAEPQSWFLWTDSIVHGVFNGQATTSFDATVERVSIAGGGGNDTIFVGALNSSTTAILNGGGGADTFGAGADQGLAFSDNVRGTVLVSGGPGIDSVSIDDFEYQNIVAYTINDTGIASSVGGRVKVDNTVESTTLTGQADYSIPGLGLIGANYSLATTAAAELTKLNVIAGPANDIFNLRSFAGTATVNGGAGSDVFTISDSGIFNIQGNIHLDGGTGTDDSITVNDSANNVLSIPALTQDTLFYTVGYANIDRMQISLGAIQNALFVSSTPLDMPVTVNGGNGDDSLTLGRLFASGANTLDQVRSPIQFNGGNGVNRIYVYDQATAAAQNWTFEPGKIVRVAEPPAGLAGLMIPLEIFYDGNIQETVLNAGMGDDTIYLVGNSGNTTLRGGAGNDDLRVLNAAAANVALFDGQDGQDLLTVSCTQAGTSNWLITNAQIRRATDGATVQYDYINYTGLEDLRVNGTTLSNNNFLVQSLSTQMHVFGGDFDDSFLLGAAGTVDGINSALYLNAGSGTGQLVLDDFADPSGDIVHVNSDDIGGTPGDTFFGVGGLVSATGISAVTINLGPGDDTMYAQPRSDSVVHLNSGDGTDELGLGLALAANYIHTANGDGSGLVSSDNFLLLDYSGAESVVLDDASPITIGYELSYDLPVQDLSFQFSEDVSVFSSLLAQGNLELINLTTDEIISSLVSWDGTTNTAHYTFPNYDDGVLPDGNYHARMLVIPRDAFGNPIVDPVEADFFFLNADANRDRKVNTLDFNILAGNFGASGKMFSEGNFNYDAAVDSVDFNILVAQYGKTLPATASTAFSVAQVSSPAGSLFRSGQRADTDSNLVAELV